MCGAGACASVVSLLPASSAMSWPSLLVWRCSLPSAVLLPSLVQRPLAKDMSKLSAFAMPSDVAIAILNENAMATRLLYIISSSLLLY